MDSSLYNWSLCVSPLISVPLCLITHLCTTGVSVSALISVPQQESLCLTTHLCTTVSHHSSLYNWNLCLGIHLCTTGVSVPHHSSLYNWNLCVSPLSHLCTTGVCHDILLCTTEVSVSLLSFVRLNSLYQSSLVSVQWPESPCPTTQISTTSKSCHSLRTTAVASI